MHMKAAIYLSSIAMAAAVAFSQSGTFPQMTPASVSPADSPGVHSGGEPAEQSSPQRRRIFIPANAADTLQTFVDEANPGDELIVAAGTYDTGGRRLNQQGPMTRLVIDKPLTLRSEKGPSETFIVGGPSTRCLYMTNGVNVIGFTIKDGETPEGGSAGDKLTALSGGGVWSEPDGLLENCIVMDSKALWYGGGLYGGSAIRCVFADNAARRSGGAASDAQLVNCLVKYNRAGRYGGGTYRSKLLNCTVTYNRAEVMGGGAAYGTAQNTVLHYNQTLLRSHNFFNVGMSYCCSMPSARGPGNIDSEPGFKNAEQGAFSLMADSPLIDAGTNNLLRVDLAGNPRILDGNNDGDARIDIGAYEYIHPSADGDEDGISGRSGIETGTEEAFKEADASSPPCGYAHVQQRSSSGALCHP
jgi:hypothetical protein